METYTRQPDGSWSFRVYEGLAAIVQMSTLAIELPLAEAFADVSFPLPAKQEES